MTEIYYSQSLTFPVDLEFIDQLLYVRGYCITAVIVVLVRQSFSDKKKKAGSIALFGIPPRFPSCHAMLSLS